MNSLSGDRTNMVGLEMDTLMDRTSLLNKYKLLRTVGLLLSAPLQGALGEYLSILDQSVRPPTPVPQKIFVRIHIVGPPKHIDKFTSGLEF